MTSPAETMRAAAKLMRERADAMEAEMRRNPYWGLSGELDERYRAGVKDGLGGAAAEMAAAFDLSAVRSLADLLMKLAWLDDVDPGGLGADIDGKLRRMCRHYLGEVTA